MATSSSYSPPRSEAGEEISPMQSSLGVPTRSFVVGRYDEYGRRTSSGEFVGGSQAGEQHRSKLMQSMRNNGKLMPGYVLSERGPVKVSKTVAAAPIVTKKGKQTKKTKVKTAEVQEVPEVETPTTNFILSEPSSELVMEPETPKAARKGFNIAFAIESGKIKSIADAILETPEALLVVYRDEDAVSYIPEKGSILTIIAPDKREIEVMYLGLQFEWYDSRQQLLVFMKTNIEE